MDALVAKYGNRDMFALISSGKTIYGVPCTKIEVVSTLPLSHENYYNNIHYSRCFMNNDTATTLAECFNAGKISIEDLKQFN